MITSDLLEKRNELCDKVNSLQEYMSAALFIRRNNLFNEKLNQKLIQAKNELIAFDMKYNISFIENHNQVKRLYK